jgi:hypothetical protein
MTKATLAFPLPSLYHRQVSEMTWLKLRDWAFAEQTWLSAEGFWQGVDFPSLHLRRTDLKEWSRERNLATHAAIEHFLLTGAWGEMPRDDRAALHMRLAWATQVLALLTLPGADEILVIPEPTASREDVLRWVFFTSWHTFGESFICNR